MKELKHICSKTLSHSVLHDISPTLKYCLNSPPTQKILNPSDPPFMSNPPQNFGELDSPLEMYPCPKQCKKTPKKQTNKQKKQKQKQTKIREKKHQLL